METSRRPHLPIGYWLKKTDEVLTARINEAQQSNGLSRTEWQILNTLHEVDTYTREQMAETMRPFVGAEELDGIVTGLAARGFVAGDGSAAAHYGLTEQGQAVHTAALERQKQMRQRAVTGISEADYATTVRVLQQLVENLTEETERPK